MAKVIIGRQEATKQLQELLASKRPELVAVVGRRRIGKTYLITQTYRDNIDFSITGLQHGTLADQLQNLRIAMQRFYPEHEVEKQPKDWLDAFHQLSQAISHKNPGKRKVIFFDELPWMATKRSKFLMAFGWFWNSWAEMNNVVVVICGSAASWMIDQVFNDRGGLHNRVTRRIFLKPFTLDETKAFLLQKSIRLNHYQITQLYMVMGGVPMYLDQVKAGKSAAENIKDICFTNQGYLWHEYPRLFSSLFDNHENHEEIIKALATKKMGMTRNEIISATRFKNGGMLSKILKQLEQSGFINIYANFKKRKRDQVYRLTDPYSLFYINFIEPLPGTSNIEFSSLTDLPQWRSWSGYAFENICLQHISKIRKALGISGIYSTVSSYRAKATDEVPGAQIDLILDRSDQTMHFCEIKFSQDAYIMTKQDAEAMRNRKSVFRFHTGSKKHFFTTFITTFGLQENMHQVSDVDQEITLDDLF